MTSKTKCDWCDNEVVTPVAHDAEIKMHDIKLQVGIGYYNSSLQKHMCTPCATTNGLDGLIDNKTKTSAEKLEDLLMDILEDMVSDAVNIQ